MVRIKPILRPQQLRAALSHFPPSQHVIPSISASTINTSNTVSSLRASYATASTATAPSTSTNPPFIPAPTPFIPDVPTFLTVIGRGLSAHASKFPDWESLFSLTSDQMRELGIEPPRARKYLLRWRQRFRAGQYGVGGDLQHVSADGTADLRILEAEPATGGESAAAAAVRPRKLVVNVPTDRPVKECGLDEMSRVRGFQVRGAKTIVGPYALPLKNGEGARITITEGMWEDKRGHKIDGGERRRTEVRYKKRIAERREMRERGEL
ncbi:Uu.00g090370.m01.CDS01 [Anthostomella pinea]|uniref:Small ribosomal subunit protein mS41 n=1 Tax=Anthostomella pinea TaxID=933095 RepID=A0AAI8VMU3_9PEZI|nr:Uu.00g090370.m01.CDS01 [Anthostomella pinea]